MKSKIVILMLGMGLLLSLFGTAKASQFGIISFTHGNIGVTFEFQEEVHPASTVTNNLNLTAYLDATIYNLTLRISGLVAEKWLVLQTEAILSRSMTQGENFTTPIMVNLPQNTSGQLYCTIDISTADKGLGRIAFYTTYVRSTTYDELLSLYNELLVNYNTLQADYNEVLTNYTALNSTYLSLVKDYNSIQTNYDALNSSYESLNASYNSLTLTYDSLREDYNYIKTKYDAALGELTIVRPLMYVFAITTVIFVAATIYFRKKAPYIVVSKETTTKTDKG